MAKPLYVFISSKMVELREERRTLEALLPKLEIDMTSLRTWVFESDASASHQSIRQTYLNALAESDLYIGLFWNEYGEWTVDEFYRAGELGIERHIYVKNQEPEKRDPRLRKFLEKQADVRFGITPRWFDDVEDLKVQVTKALEKWLLDRQIAHHSATSAVVVEDADNVPELPKQLIGRDALIGEILELLEDNERVLLHGFGGVGKSALAATAAADWIDEGNGSVIWIKAGNAPVDVFYEEIGRALGEHQAVASVTGDARVQVVRRLLKEQGGTIVLDDVWNGNALAQFVKAMPRRMPLLVTSRLRFPLDEIINVGALTPEQALKLLGFHLRRRDFSDDPDAARLCKLLGYHAFALEIASKTLKVYQITPTDLLQRIEDAPHDLSMPANFGELGRTGIKSLLDASIDALNREQLDLFVAMGGLFEPSATPALLAFITGQDEEEIDDILQQLAVRGLVNALNPRGIVYYRLHDLAYSYAKTMFHSKGISPQATIEGCLKYTEKFLNDLEALNIEQSNILEAAELAHRSDQSDILVDIMRFLTVDGPYFAARGHTSSSLELLKDAIEFAKENDRLEDAHYLLSKLGNVYKDFLGDLEAALATYRHALDLAVTLDDSHRQAILLSVIGSLRFQQNADDADEYHERAYQIASDTQDDFARCQILQNRSYQAMYQSKPNYDLGRQLSDEAAQIAAEIDFVTIQFGALLNRGSCELELGMLDEALATSQEAYRLAEGQGNLMWMAYALRVIAEYNQAMEQRDEAQENFDKALNFLRRCGATSEANNLIEYMQVHNYTVSE